MGMWQLLLTFTKVGWGRSLLERLQEKMREGKTNQPNKHKTKLEIISPLGNFGSKRTKKWENS